jgi:hypothetical protein
MTSHPTLMLANVLLSRSAIPYGVDVDLDARIVG